jgi:hypothetical protein
VCKRQAIAALEAVGSVGFLNGLFHTRCRAV